MKKLLLLFAILAGISFHCVAQNYTEVVYLKNGSIIRGVIIEQVPNSSLKIQTADGNIFVFSMAEVEKITKEATLANPSKYEKPGKTKSRLKGYKGFIETGYVFDVSDYNTNRFALSTTHGYQFNDYLFAGGGLGINLYSDLNDNWNDNWNDDLSNSSYSIPMYFTFRANFTKNRITPFADINTGYTAGDIQGAFVTIGIGVRFSLAKKMAINLKLEYAYQEIVYNYEYEHYYNYEYDSTDGIGIKLGFEF